MNVMTMRLTNNKTTLYLIPIILATESYKYIDLFKHGFVDAFLEDHVFFNNYPNCIYLLFKVNNSVSFGKMINNWSSIVGEFDFNEFTVLACEIPKNYLQDYNLFLKGEYSKVSKNYKDLFSNNPAASEKQWMKNVGLTSDYSITYMIFNKKPQYKRYLEESLGIRLSNEMELESIHSEKDLLTEDLLQTNK